jgi:hypothetical protein
MIGETDADERNVSQEIAGRFEPSELTLLGTGESDLKPIKYRLYRGAVDGERRLVLVSETRTRDSDWVESVDAEATAVRPQCPDAERLVDAIPSDACEKMADPMRVALAVGDAWAGMAVEGIEDGSTWVNGVSVETDIRVGIQDRIAENGCEAANQEVPDAAHEAIAEALPATDSSNRNAPMRLVGGDDNPTPCRHCGATTTAGDAVVLDGSKRRCPSCDQSTPAKLVDRTERLVAVCPSCGSDDVVGQPGNQECRLCPWREPSNDQAALGEY